MSKLTLSQIIDGYRLAAAARRLSPRTLEDYDHTFHLLQDFLAGSGLSDPAFIDIHKSQLEAFLAAQTTISKKTLLNYHTGLSALWTWAAAEGYTTRNLLHEIERPTPEKRVIIPFSEAEIRALLDGIQRSRTYAVRGSPVSFNLANQERNRAILLLLLDTGLRADELCGARIQDLDLKRQFVKVYGKGSKERLLPFCSRTAQVLWKYLSKRPEARPDEPLFVTQEGTAFNRHRLHKQLTAISRRAGVSNVHAHRFRHTFAINFLRNGGNVYTLQMILGHTTMEMVRKYLNLAMADIENAHRLASPVANMRL